MAVISSFVCLRCDCGWVWAEELERGRERDDVTNCTFNVTNNLRWCFHLSSLSRPNSPWNDGGLLRMFSGVCEWKGKELTPPPPRLWKVAHSGECENEQASPAWAWWLRWLKKFDQSFSFNRTKYKPSKNEVDLRIFQFSQMFQWNFHRAQYHRHVFRISKLLSEIVLHAFPTVAWLSS